MSSTNNGITTIGRKSKVWNINTPKFHSLGDVTSYIRVFGTTDSYSTQLVRGSSLACFFCQLTFEASPNDSIASLSHGTGERTRRRSPIKFPTSKLAKEGSRSFAAHSLPPRMKASLKRFTAPRISSGSPRITQCSCHASSL